MIDDREAFESGKRADASRMSRDSRLASECRLLTAKVDRYNYTYFWSWLGIPIVQMPEDMVALQEIIWETRPEVIVETGIARGGSLIFYSAMLELVGAGEVIGIDREIRAHNRQAIETHPMSKRVHMIEGSSTDPGIVEQVVRRIGDRRRVMVVLDSDHTHDHVLQELRLYAPLVTENQFLVVADTVVEEIPVQDHRPRPWGPGNNPMTALRHFLKETDRFSPDPFFNSKLAMTSSPGGYLRCLAPKK